MTVADLLYYNEISTVTALTRRYLTNEEFPNLAPWFNQNMSTIPEVKSLDD